jgi:hypothetical protein
MATASPMLDEALLAVSALEFAPPNHFVSHAPMACEALAALGYEERLTEWVPHFAAQLGPAADPVAPRPGATFDWEGALGDGRRLPEWLGHFERAIADDGWRPVVERWVPRLMPGLSAALFHGVIRTAHAVRAVEAADTGPRRAELARALGNWASWYEPGEPVHGVVEPDDARRGALDAALDGARCFVAAPGIYHLHGVTGAVAVARLSGHVAPGPAAAALAQLRADHAALYASVERAVPDGDAPGWPDAAADAAAGSFDAHQIKLVDACAQGFEVTGDGAFAVAARIVSGRS